MKISLKKVIYILLGCLLISITLCALMLMRATGDAQKALANTRRQLRDQGFKTDLAEFDYTADNATRTRAAALQVFDKRLELDEEGNQLDFMPAVSNDTATVIWQQNSLKLGDGILEWQFLQAVFATNREAINAACDAVLSGPIAFDIDMAQPGSRRENYWTSLHYLSQALSSRVILDLHDGNLNAAWTNLYAATRLVTAWKPDSTRVGHILHFVMAEAAFADTWQALQTNGWSNEKLAALQHEWESVDVLANLPETIALDRAVYEQRFQQINKTHPFAGLSFSKLAKNAFEKPSSAYRDVKEGIDLMRYHGNVAMTEEKNLLLNFRDRELQMRHAIQSPTWVEMRAQLGVSNVIPFKSEYSYMLELTKSYEQSQSMQPMIAAGTEARRRILIMTLALERYRIKHGSYPVTLAGLAPEFVNTVLVDFMDGQPLRYHLTDDGHFVLYSVGLDCVDDGGKLPNPDAPRFPKARNGIYGAPTNVDIVWPRPDTSSTHRL